MDDTIIDRKILPQNLWPGWETVRLIGEGSYGAVYEIRREVAGFEENAALKVISLPRGNAKVQTMLSGGYSREDITKHFQECLLEIEREYGVMAQVKNCDNIVKCDDLRIIQHDNDIGWDVFIKMEMLAGMTKYLDEKYCGELVMPDEEVAAFGKAMCNALAECERHKVIHRDIKPQNILVSKNGTYKLGDFGTARTVESSTGLTGGIGTKNYMSPEVAASKKYDYRADIYSVGMVMYWMLNERRLPFLPLPPKMPSYSETTEALQKRLEGNELPAPAHGSDALKAIVLKACSFEMTDRYENADRMLAELERITSEKPNPIDGKRRNKKLIALLAAIAAVIIGISAVTIINRGHSSKLGKQELTETIAPANADDSDSELQNLAETDASENGDILDADEAEKMVALGDMLYHNSNEYKKACELYEEALKAGIPSAYRAMGMAYMDGFGVEQDFDKAEEYLQIAYDAGDIYTPLALGDFYHWGSDRLDFEKAYNCYIKGLELNPNDMWLNLNLAIMYYNGEYVERDVDKGIELMKKSAKLGNPNAYLQLGWWYMEKPDGLSEATAYFSKAAELGNEEAKEIIHQLGNG